LQFLSVEPAHLVVETPNAVATAVGTRFFIGHHNESNRDQAEPDPKETMNRRAMTRMLVLAGMVTMTTSAGSVQAAENEAAVVGATGAPEKIAVEANSKFASDLYERLAAENTGGNLFFSPYSISTALMMTAEGARGDTANEMGNVLGFPEALRRTGEDAQNIPWETGKLHVGLAALNRLFNRERETPERLAIEEDLANTEKLLVETKAQTVKLKAQQDWDGYRKNAAVQKKLVGEINAARQKIDTLELEVANALWGEKTYPFTESYIETIADAYETNGLQQANFKEDYDAERQRINAWVEGKTKERIKNLLPPNSLDKFTRLVLVNAIYFKGDWATPFKTKDTKEAEFTLSGGKTTQVPLMNKYSLTGARYAAFNGDGSFFDTPALTKRGETKNNYPGDDGFSMVELPYRGGEVSMLVIAPNTADSLAVIESKLGSENLTAWIGQLKARKVHVTLPKFRSETTYKMNDTLSAMGMVSAFKDPRFPGGADFGGMTDATDPMQKLYIALVMHKAFVDVSEKGTEAAAATAVAMAMPVSAPISQSFTPHFRADRPFIYLIRDTKTGSILFLGRMMNPKA
jgi:serpin B